MKVRGGEEEGRVREKGREGKMRGWEREERRGEEKAERREKEGGSEKDNSTQHNTRRHRSNMM